MGKLLETPSNGKSEVLATLHYQGALASGVRLVNLGPMVSRRYGGDENRAGSDAVFEADLITVVGQLQTAGYVVGHADATGATIDLTASPPSTTRVVLTGAGRAEARHPRPRPVRIFD